MEKAVAAKRKAGGRDEPEEEEELKPSLFPLFPLSDSSLQDSSKVPQWLCNNSFTTELSVVEEAVSSRYNLTLDEEKDDVDEYPQPKPTRSYDLLDSSASDQGRDHDTEREKRGRKKKKKKRMKSRERTDDDYASRKSGVRAWAGSETKPSKDYYFDSHGDRDNLAFGSLYRPRSLLVPKEATPNAPTIRMDVACYKLYNSSKSF